MYIGIPYTACTVHIQSLISSEGDWSNELKGITGFVIMHRKPFYRTTRMDHSCTLVSKANRGEQRQMEYVLLVSS